MIRTEEEHLAHYGILRKSGRYPWGSGNTQGQRNKDFLSITREQKKQGLTDAEIAKYHGITRNELTAARTIAIAEQKESERLEAQRLKDKGWSNTEIGRRMGRPESSIRAMLKPGAADRNNALYSTANMLKSQVDEKSMIDIGTGVEKMIGVTKSRFETAVAMLKEQGYKVHVIYQPQQNIPGKYTQTKILTKPNIDAQHVNTHREDIRLITEYSYDQGRSFLGVAPPISVSSRRIKIRYNEDGGAETDGMIYIRPGVKDLSIGSKRYGQVRIAVDGTHYLKGMAVYKDDLPAGVDIEFSTKAHNTGRKKDAMKLMKTNADGTIDEANPFGSIIRQIHGPDGKVTSAVNLVGSPTKEGSGEEGTWDTWKRDLSSQMLSKQDPKLAEQQLALTFDRRVREYNEIKSLTNNVVKRDLLNKFADQTDAAAVHLHAASLPRTANKVLIPIPSMKPDQIFAPGFNDGDRVVLIRHPHGGTFEIPELTVNNRNREARKTIGKNAADAVGIHHQVAERLSGADFDGDTVLVIPNNKKLIKHTPALEGLKGFDPMDYRIPKDSPIPVVTNQRKQHEMGIVSNLITDMTLQGATPDKMARAIRHSMVVIDSEKHQLNYKLSEKDNGIAALREEYQGRKGGGAVTIISRAKSPEYIPQRKPRPAREGGPVDPATGKKVYVPTGAVIRRTRIETDPATGRKIRVPTGETKPRMEEHPRLSLVDDAYEIIPPSRRTPIVTMEHIYAQHSNQLKAMANQARKEALPLKGTKASPSAKKVYATEVESLKAKLAISEKNAPYERHAQRLAQSQLNVRRQANPGMTDEEVKKTRQQLLNEARLRTGAKKYKMKITQPEWDAIQAHAVSTDVLERILYNSDSDTVKALAMPKHTPKLTSTKLLRAQRMLADGYTQQEVADHLGIGLTTLKVGLSE